MTTKTTNGIVTKPDGTVVMLCGNNEIEIRFLDSKGEPVKDNKDALPKC